VQFCEHIGFTTTHIVTHGDDVIAEALGVGCDTRAIGRAADSHVIGSASRYPLLQRHVTELAGGVVRMIGIDRVTIGMAVDV